MFFSAFSGFWVFSSASWLFFQSLLGLGALRGLLGFRFSGIGLNKVGGLGLVVLLYKGSEVQFARLEGRSVSR